MEVCGGVWRWCSGVWRWCSGGGVVGCGGGVVVCGVLVWASMLKLGLYHIEVCSLLSVMNSDCL